MATPKAAPKSEDVVVALARLVLKVVEHWHEGGLTQTPEYLHLQELLAQPPVGAKKG